MLLCLQINLKMKKHNFSAGPCILPQEVMQKAAQAVVELDNSGLSLIEISHRSPAFVEIIHNVATASGFNQRIGHSITPRGKGCIFDTIIDKNARRARQQRAVAAAPLGALAGSLGDVRRSRRVRSRGGHARAGGLARDGG